MKKIAIVFGVAVSVLSLSAFADNMNAATAAAAANAPAPSAATQSTVQQNVQQRHQKIRQHAKQQAQQAKKNMNQSQPITAPAVPADPTDGAPSVLPATE